MKLRERLQQDMHRAAKDRKALAVSALRMAIAEVKNREIEERGELSDEGVLKVLASLVKRGREAVDLYAKGNRPDLVEKESAEIAILEGYLPKGLSDAEVEALVREAIAAAGVSGPSAVGRVMKDVMPRVAGRADGKKVNEIVRRLLAG